MTSVVKVTAHCADNKEVVVKVIDIDTQEVKNEQVLQNGESTEKHIYDNLAVTAVEIEKLDSDLKQDDDKTGGEGLDDDDNQGAAGDKPAEDDPAPDAGDYNQGEDLQQDQSQAHQDPSLDEDKAGKQD